MSGLDVNLFMSMLKDKPQILTSLIADLDSCAQNFAAFEKLERLYKVDPAQVSTEKALSACAKSLRHLNEVNRRMLMLLIVYASGDNFSADVGRVLIKLGHGEAALQEMFNQKMGKSG